MMYVFAKPATALRLNGTLAMLALLLLYASPLSSLLHVVRTRNAASILLPWTLAALGCSSTWFVYGLATKQVPVMVPHGLGMLLSVVQLGLRAVLPSRDSGGGTGSESASASASSASSSSDEEGYEDEEAAIGGRQRVVGGAGSPTGCRRGGRGRSRSLSSCLDWEDSLGKGGQLGKGASVGKGASSSGSYHHHHHHHHHDTFGGRPHHHDHGGSGGGKRDRSVSAGRASEAGSASSSSSSSGVTLMRRMLPLGRPPQRTLSRVGMLEMADRAGGGEEEEDEEDEESRDAMMAVDLEAGESTRTTPEPADEKEEDRPLSI